MIDPALVAAVERDFIAAWWLLADVTDAERRDRADAQPLGFRFVCDLVPYRSPRLAGSGHPGTRHSGTRHSGTRLARRIV